MEKRLLLFWILTCLILFAYFQRQAQRQALFKEEQEQAAAVADGSDKDQGPSQGESGASALEDGDRSPASPDAGTLPAGPDERQAEIGRPEELDQDAPSLDAVPADIPTQRVVLGSLAPDSPYTAAWYLTSQGGGVERIELNESKYSDRENRSGYLGFLAFDYASAGCIVQVVPPGSPAALAKNSVGGSADGLIPGDEIVAINGQSVRIPSDIDMALEKTRPGDSITLDVRRKGDPKKLEFSTQLMRRPLAVVQVSGGDQGVTPQKGIPSFLLTLAHLDRVNIEFGKDEIARLPSLLRGNWSTHPQDETTVEFRRVLSAGDLKPLGIAGPIELIKRYRIAESAVGSEPRKYHLVMDVEVHNRSNVPHQLAWRLDGANGLPTEGWWYLTKTHPRNWSAAGARDVIYREKGGIHQMVTSGSIVKQTEDASSPETQMTSGSAELEYIGVDTQYFSVVLQSEATPGPGPEGQIPSFAISRSVGRLAEPVDPQNKRLANTTCRIDSPIAEIQPGGSLQHSYRLFAGPKEPTVLDSYGLNECIVYGWGIFAAVAKPMTSLLHGLRAIVGNYGIAIVLLTVLVRGCMFPLSRQQVASAKRMQELGPEMRRIGELHKNDMEAKAKAQQELLRKNNVNPLSGCLPGLVQLPIFIGLYRCLNVDIALRGAPLLPGFEWCSNLAAPDQLLEWPSFVPAFLAGHNGYLGPFLNVLPIVSCGLFLLQQKMFTPPPTDEQQEMQHKMMNFMTLFMGVLLFKVPSGLCIYFISSSLWALAERKLLPKTPPGATATVTSPSPGPAPATPKSENAIVTWFQQRGSQPDPVESREERKKRRDRRRN